VIWDNLQHLPHHFDVGDVIAEETQVSSEPGEAVCEVLRVLRLLPHQGAKVTSQLLCVCLTHALDPDADPLDCLPC
jgi:hypothetical protein